MGWKQTKAFDISKAGTEKYLCLKNVRLGYGIASKWEYARQDWDNNLGKHADQNFPAGVAVPVYFSWVGTLDGIRRDWGHVAVRLPDGRIWTDGKYYANVSELSKNYISGGTYLGWGESVNGVRVVEYVPEPERKSNEEIATEVIQGKWGNGEERKRRLTEAGYDYSAIQAIVNARMNSQQPAPAAQYYTVAKGDSLSKIAGRYGTTWQKLYEMNRQVIGPDPNKIFPGQKLRVK